MNNRFRVPPRALRTTDMGRQQVVENGETVLCGFCARHNSRRSPFPARIPASSQPSSSTSSGQEIALKEHRVGELNDRTGMYGTDGASILRDGPTVP